MTVPVIELVDVVRTYPGEPPINALDGVTLSISAREMIAIIGPSGSGKSTLLNIMGTLDRSSSGSVRIDGVDIVELTERQLCGVRATRLGFVFQSFHLIETATVVENVANGLLYQGLSRRSRNLRALDALELVGLGDRASTKPPKLSGGQRQRVAIARAIVAKPSLILADEPTGNLDSRTSADILALLDDLNRVHDATIAVITHDNDVADRFQRCIRMRDGKIENQAHTGGVSS